MVYTTQEIGKLVKESREEKNLTQDELARRIKKNRSYISRLENGGANVNIKTLVDIIENGLGGSIKINVDLLP